jgi:signal peptidase I
MKNLFDINLIGEKQRRLWTCDDTPMLIIIFIAIYVFVSYIVPTYLLTPVNILGNSMEPTLYENDKVILYMQGDIDYGDIIVIYAPNVPNHYTLANGEEIIKRVMGLPGDTVWFEKDGEDYVFHRKRKVNGMEIETVIKDEFYVIEKNDRYSQSDYDTKYRIGSTFILGEDEYFVLGDNRPESLDSRSSMVGLVKRKDIIGKALFMVREGKLHIFDGTVFK